MRSGFGLVLMIAVAACSAAPSTVPSQPPASEPATASALPTASAPPSATSSPSTASSAAPSATPLIEWRGQPTTGIPSTALVSGIATGSGSSPLIVAVGVSDFGAAVASTEGDRHLGAAWLSKDGTTWSQVRIATARILSGVVYRGTTFVAVGEYSGPPPTNGPRLAAYTTEGPPGAWTSQDGRRWTFAKIAGKGEVLGILASRDGLLALGTVAEASVAWMSRDGIRWTSHVVDQAGGVGAIIARRDGGYLAVGGSSEGACADQPTPTVWTSADGIAWTAQPIDDGVCGGLESVVLGPAGYVGTGLTGDASRVMARVSRDGRTWTTPVEITAAGCSEGLTTCPRRLGVIDGVYLAMGDQSWDSADGSIWADEGGSGPSLREGVVGPDFVLEGDGSTAWYPTRR